MIREELTGNQRHRIQSRFFKSPLMVLQVEVREHGSGTEFVGGVVDTVDVDRTYYRDATLEDVSANP